MNTVLFTVTGLVCAIIWLSLLVATGFNPAAVSTGLLAVLVVSGRSQSTPHFH